MQIRPLGFYAESEYPEATEVLMQLEKAVIDGMKNGKYLSALIGVDVMITAPAGESAEKRSALQIRCYNIESEEVLISYSIYEQSADGYTFSELFEL